MGLEVRDGGGGEQGGPGASFSTGPSCALGKVFCPLRIQIPSPPIPEDAACFREVVRRGPAGQPVLLVPRFVLLRPSHWAAVGPLVRFGVGGGDVSEASNE